MRTVFLLSAILISAAIGLKLGPDARNIIAWILSITTAMDFLEFVKRISKKEGK